MSSESVLLPPNPSAAYTARRHIAAACQHWPAALLEVAVLLASELVTNAVTHGAGNPTIRLACASDVLRIEVSDSSPVQPRLAAADVHSEHGRGLQLVAALASRWGTEVSEHGKIVWAELHRDRRAPPHR